MITARSGFGYFLMLGAYALLIPGLTEPVLHVVSVLDKSELAVLGKEAILSSEAIPNFLLPVAMDVLNQVHVEGKIVINDTSNSILQTSQTLWNDGNVLVACLIILFSVFIPVIKLLFLAFAMAFKHAPIGHRLSLASSAMSKWSMADVFVMALLIAFLATKASTGNAGMVSTSITLEAGFYFFLGYCLLSILASQLLFIHREPVA